MEFPTYTFPLESDFDHHQSQNTDPKTELVPISLVKPFFFSENTLPPVFFYGSWVPATNKQLLMIIISPHILITE